MSGYPQRLVRDQLGPSMDETVPVTNPEQQVGGRQFNLEWQQLAGLNLAMITRAVIVADWNGSDFDVSYQEEAWNAKHAQSHPVLARAGTGDYTYTFAATYDDQDGNAISTVLLAPRASAQKVITTFASRVDAYAYLDAADPLIVHVKLFDGSGTAVDEPFILEVG